MKDPRTAKIIIQTYKKAKSALSSGGESSQEAISAEMQLQMDDSNPLRNLCTWYKISEADYKKLMTELKKAVKQ